MRILRGAIGILTSTRVGVAVMAVLAVWSLLGAVIPQGGEPDAYVGAYGELRGRLVLALGLNGVFHSAYFAGLLIFLCIMVFACSLKRLPRKMRLAHSREFIFDEDRIAGMPNRGDLVLDHDEEESWLHVVDICRRRLYSVSLRAGEAPEAGGAPHAVFASKMGLSRYGSFILHLSFIFLLAGGISGTRLGSRYLEEVRVGEDLTLRAGGDQFAVSVEDFTVEFDDRDRVSDYVCEVSYRDERDGLTWYRIRPNHPLRYVGNEVFLVSFSEDPSVPEGFVVSVYDSAGQVILPHFFAGVCIGDYYEELGATVKAVHGVVPSLTLIFDDGRVETHIIERDPSAAGAGESPYSFVLVHAVPSLAVLLEVVREPGQSLIIGGLALLTLGSFVSLYLSHRRIWFILMPLPGQKTRVVFGGRANRNGEGFTREFESIKDTLDELS
ncbi:MAG: cytochrome c biogenesis protein ResB [Candidatus Eisenbacteria bacterium]